MLEGVSSVELATILNDYNIFVRDNDFCINKDFDGIRVSIHIYNNTSDIDRLISVLKEIKSIK